MTLKILWIHDLFDISINSLGYLPIYLIQFVRQYHLFNKWQSVLIKSGVNFLEIFKTLINLVVKLDCFIVNIYIKIEQLFEHVFERTEAFLIPIETC